MTVAAFDAGLRSPDDANSVCDRVQRAVSVPRQGGLVVPPTGAVYGLAAVASKPRAVARFFEPGIVAPAPDPGLGHALHDRLRRAAGQGDVPEGADTGDRTERPPGDNAR